MSGHERKKVDRGIEEIAHYFLSSRTRDDSCSNGGKRWIPFYSCGSSIQKSFLMTNLFFRIAAEKKRVAVFDYETADHEAFLYLKHLKQKIEGKNGNGFYRIKDLPAGSEEVLIIPSDCLETENSFGRIEREIGAVNLIFVNMPSKILSEKSKEFRTFRENIVITSPEEKEMIGNYILIKTIYEINPDALIGLIVSRVKEVSQAIEVFEKMAEASFKFLKKELLSFGFFYDDLIIQKSVLQGKPMFLLDSYTKIQRCLSGITNIFLDEKMSGSNNSHRRDYVPLFRSGIIEDDISLEEKLHFSSQKGKKLS